MAQQVRVGCSGWQYKHWRDDFYTGFPQSRWFERYASVFDTVEINNSFYRLPPPETFDQWRRAAPPGFLYAVKASRFLTHMKKLNDPEEPLMRFFDHASVLDRCLGPVLYQLPPHWPLNLERLEHFLQVLPPHPWQTIEFREPSWYDERVFALLRKHNVSLCLHDMDGAAWGPSSWGPPSGGPSFVYVRFHGTTKYGGRYPDAQLDAWADWLNDRIDEGLDVFAYFNNDSGGHAPRDAVRLRARLNRRG